jgi:hypothetical protein
MAGRPRLHPTQADKQFAYRQRQREKRDTGREQLAAWLAVRAAATATGVLTGDESEFEAGRKIACALDTASDAAPVFIPLL